MKKFFTVALLIMASVFHTQLFAQLTITEAEGWLESAWVKWTPVANANSYNVYYSGEGITEKKIDEMLVREYADYYRADVLGLKAGTYTIKVVAVIDDQESESATTTSLTVLAHDRSGFAHATDSPKGTASGAYNDDGTLKENAEIVYITPLNANQLDIYTNYLKPREKKDHPLKPLIIRFIGTISQSNMPGINSTGLLQLKGNSANYNQQVTFEGVGDDTYLEFGLDIVRSSNIEIRNLGFKSFQEDGVSIQSDNTNIWLHNCDFFYGQNKGGDKKKGDGASDIKDSQWCTVSYNHYWDSGKANLFGNSDDTIDYITYHHNFLDHSDSRHPRVRCAQRVHVYNNYFMGVGKYGIGAARKSSVFVESNYFENSKNPMLSSKQGTDILDGDGSGTFSGEDSGIIKSYNNKIVNLKGNYRPWSATGEQATDFDAYEATDRFETVPSTVVGKQGGHIYSNFDQNLGYTPLLDMPDVAKENVMKYAGRVNGGDMKITFGATDYLKTDDPDPVITALIEAHTCLILAYTEGGSGQIVTPGEPEEIEGDVIHDFTSSGKESSFFIINGNLSTGKGTVSYGGLTLTQCLKIESATSIKFTITEEATLTLVFESGSKKVKINGETYTSSASGILTMSLEAGDYEITKSDSTNLFYMSIEYTEDVEPTNISSTDAQAALTLYPNPATETVYIQTELSVVKVEIYNLAGSLMKVSNEVANIDVSGLSAGSYLIRVYTEEGIRCQLIIKK